MTFYLRNGPDGQPTALYEGTNDGVRIWRGGEWRDSARTKSELDGLGGDSDFYPIPDNQVNEWKMRLG